MATLTRALNQLHPGELQREIDTLVARLERIALTKTTAPSRAINRSSTSATIRRFSVRQRINAPGGFARGNRGVRDDPQVSECSGEGLEQIELVKLVRLDPAGLGQLGVHRAGKVESVPNLDQVGPVGPSAVIVLVDLDDVVRVKGETDLLLELPERRVERRLVEIDRSTRDGPRAAVVGPEGPTGQEEELALLAGVSDEDACGSIATPAWGPVSGLYEAVTRYPVIRHGRNLSAIPLLRCPRPPS